MLYSVFFVYFDVLLEDSHLTTSAANGELSGIMEMAKDLAIVFVVRIVRTKRCWTCTACKMIRVVSFVQGNNVRSAKSLVACGTEKTKTSKVIMLTERVNLSVFSCVWEKLVSGHRVAILIAMDEH